MSVLQYKLIFYVGKSRQKNKIRGKNLSTVVIEEIFPCFLDCSGVSVLAATLSYLSLRYLFEALSSFCGEYFLNRSCASSISCSKLCGRCFGNEHSK